jgi:hypothetical protein
MEWFIVLVVYGLLLYALGKLAIKKNREPAGWVIAGVILNPLLLIVVLACLKDLPKRKLKRKRR